MPLENPVELQRSVRAARETLLALGLRFEPATPYVMPVLGRTSIAGLQHRYHWACDPEETVSYFNHPAYSLNTDRLNRANVSGVFNKSELDETGATTYTLGALFSSAVLKMFTETVDDLHREVELEPSEYPVGMVPIFYGVPEEGVDYGIEALKDSLLAQRPSVTFSKLLAR